jgi:hypothetical protein
MAYVYRHIRLDKNEPFYIGVGNDKYKSRSRNKTRRNDIWKSITSKTDYEVEILIDDLSYNQALEKEKEFIALYGRINLRNGTLANLTDGGDGTIGVKRTEEYKEKVRKTLTGKKLSETHRKNISNGCKGRRHTEDSIEKMRIKKVGKKRPDVIERASKKVLNTITNEIYSSLRIVSNLYNIKYSTLANQLNGSAVNKTIFIYL